MEMLPQLYIILGFVIPAALLGISAWLLICSRQRWPRFKKSDILHHEWFASGFSRKNILTKIGGARNCLRLIVAQNFLLVTSWFPFFLLAPLYDLEHVVPLGAIDSVRRDKFFGQNSFLLTYHDSKGKLHWLRLFPRRPDDFIRSLGVKIDGEVTT